MRKVVGAQRRQLVVQFWGEALIMSLSALLLGMVLAELSLPIFNEFANKQLQFHYASDGTTLAMLAGLVLLTGFIAGSYPALVLSRFKPIETLTNRLKLGGSNVFTKSLYASGQGLRNQRLCRRGELSGLLWSRTRPGPQLRPPSGHRYDGSDPCQPSPGACIQHDGPAGQTDSRSPNRGRTDPL